MLSIVRTALNVRYDTHLFFGVERESDIFAQRELLKLAGKHLEFRLTIAIREGDQRSASYRAHRINGAVRVHGKRGRRRRDGSTCW
jgi:hypothetical protein